MRKGKNGSLKLRGYSRLRIPDDQIEAHFWSKVDKNGPIIRPELGPCWIWTATTNGRYPVFNVHRKHVYAHRFAYELTYGPLAPGEQARHKCDNGHGKCVRPEHLEPGTALDNSRDAQERGRLIRSVCRNGHVYAEVGVYVDGPESKKPGKRQCRTCSLEGKQRHLEACRIARDRAQAEVVRLAQRCSSDGCGNLREARSGRCFECIGKMVDRLGI